jgi:hypothetical protein
MRITIEGARQAPSWGSWDRILSDSLGADRCGAVIRISRLDGQHGYRELGTYELNFEYIRYATREVELVVLEVK